MTAGATLAEPDVIHAHCNSCDAEMVIRATERTERCPFCDATAVVLRPAVLDRPQPTFVLGFVLDREDAARKAMDWIGRQRMPLSGLETAVAERITGMYLPVYLAAVGIAAAFDRIGVPGACLLPMTAITADCPRCGSAYETDDLRCPVCALAFPPPEDTGPHERTMRVQVFRCSDCSGGMEYSAKVQAPLCAFCGSVVKLEAFADPVEQIDTYLPFTVDRHTALDVYQRWLSQPGGSCCQPTWR